MSGVWACNSHVGLLIRTWACCSEPGSPNPHAGLLFRAWAMPPTLQLAGLRAI